MLFEKRLLMKNKTYKSHVNFIYDIHNSINNMNAF